jgi:flagellar biosynthesis/type III secretory pathway M-ring protein FliF/YscJ
VKVLGGHFAYSRAASQITSSLRLQGFRYVFSPGSHIVVVPEGSTTEMGVRVANG